MRDAAMVEETKVARMLVELDERAIRARNALTVAAPPGFQLTTGDVGTVLETFGNGEAFLVEFNHKSGAVERCDWMGVLYPTEIEVGETLHRSITE